MSARMAKFIRAPSVQKVCTNDGARSLKGKDHSCTSMHDGLSPFVHVHVHARLAVKETRAGGTGATGANR